MYLTHQQKDRHFSTFQQNPATPSRSISPQIQASSTVTICVKRGSSAFLKTNNYRRQSQHNAIRTFALHLWGQLVGSRVNKLIIDAQVQWLFWDILVAAYKPTMQLIASVNNNLAWWGRIAQMDSAPALHPVTPGLILGIAEIYWRHCLEQWTEAW